MLVLAASNNTTALCDDGCLSCELGPCKGTGNFVGVMGSGGGGGQCSGNSGAS